MPTPTVRHLAALGSSFASGPGIEPYADKRAWRSSRNYAHLLAERLGCDLTDLTVAGATTATILERPQRMLWRKFPPQLPQLPRDADLVTVTAGGNDLGYISSMIALSYRAWLSQRRTTRTLAPLLARHGVPALTESTLDQTTANLVAIVAAITKQAPGARVVLVGYLTVLDADTPTGPDAPFPAATRDSLRAVAAALADAFADAAKVSGPRCTTKAGTPPPTRPRSRPRWTPACGSATTATRTRIWSKGHVGRSGGPGIGERDEDLEPVPRRAQPRHGSGHGVGIWDCTGGANQQWNLTAGGTVVGRESGLCLDVTGAGNQKWSRR